MGETIAQNRYLAGQARPGYPGTAEPGRQFSKDPQFSDPAATDAR
jgi:hypothetical protein